MTKSELVQRLLARYPHLYKRDIETILNIIFGQIAAALARDDRVELRGFGSFSIRHRKARIGRNPATGDKVQVSDKGYSYFKTGKSMLDRLNRAIAGSALSAPRARLMAYSAADVLRQGQGVSRL